MEGIKRFITLRIPVYACNFRCSYCYVGQHQGAYKKGIIPFIKSPEYIAKFFLKERLGGKCYFNCCADGETTLHPQLVELVSRLTGEGHFVDIITNGSQTEKLKVLCSQLDNFQKENLFIKFSFHYLELKRRNLLEEYVSNVNLIKNSGISYTVEITPHDELIPYIDEIKEFSLKNFGALPHITVARNEATNKIELLTKLSRDKYIKTWSVFDSALFDFKISIFGKKRKEFCYAGLWSLNVNLHTGFYSQCYIGDRLGNICDISKPINFRPICRCRQPHCFNGHAFLAFGLCPDLETTSYMAERNRKRMGGGGEFLTSPVKEFFKTKLKDSNSFSKKKAAYFRIKENDCRLGIICKHIVDKTKGKISHK